MSEDAGIEPMTVVTLIRYLWIARTVTLAFCIMNAHHLSVWKINVGFVAWRQWNKDVREDHDLFAVV